MGPDEAEDLRQRYWRLMDRYARLSEAYEALKKQEGIEDGINGALPAADILALLKHKQELAQVKYKAALRSDGIPRAGYAAAVRSACQAGDAARMAAGWILDEYERRLEVSDGGKEA